MAGATGGEGTRRKAGEVGLHCQVACVQRRKIKTLLSTNRSRAINGLRTYSALHLRKTILTGVCRRQEKGKRDKVKARAQERDDEGLDMSSRWKRIKGWEAREGAERH